MATVAAVAAVVLMEKGGKPQLSRISFVTFVLQAPTCALGRGRRRETKDFHSFVVGFYSDSIILSSYIGYDVLGCRRRVFLSCSALLNSGSGQITVSASPLHITEIRNRLYVFVLGVSFVVLLYGRYYLGMRSKYHN